MRKQELIHLHGLFEEVSEYWPQEVDLTEYESLGVGASMIDRRKHEHEQAIFALADAITDDFEHERTVVEPPRTG